MSQENIILETYHGVGVIKLNRPKALNALSLDMLLGIQNILKMWRDDPAILFVYITSTTERAFCVGGDVKSVVEHALQRDYEYGRNYLKEEYKTDLMIHEYPKPVISFLHGYVLGGGAGIAMASSIRITSEDAYFGMPEVHIGFFPDVGASYFLTRMPRNVGKYLGVTGKLINSDDLLYLGISHYKIIKDRFDLVENYLFTHEWQENTFETELHALFQKYHDPSIEGSVIKPMINFIEKFYENETYNKIYFALEHDGSKEALEHMKYIRGLCNTSIQLTLELLKRGKKMSLRECFKMEYDLGYNLIDSTNFLEGVKAVLIEKTGNPEWIEDDRVVINKRGMELVFNKWRGPEPHPLDRDDE